MEVDMGHVDEKNEPLKLNDEQKAMMDAQLVARQEQIQKDIKKYGRPLKRG